MNNILKNLFRKASVEEKKSKVIGGPEVFGLALDLAKDQKELDRTMKQYSMDPNNGAAEYQVILNSDEMACSGIYAYTTELGAKAIVDKAKELFPESECYSEKRA